jgi:hypothetical protein
MPDSTLEIPQQNPKLRALLSDPGFQRLKKVSPAEAAMLEDSARNGTPLDLGGAPSGGRAPATATFGRPVMPEIARKAKLSDQAQTIMRAGQELQNLYNNRIAPKLKSGKINSMGQGLEYTYRGIARPLGYEPDPDVQDFITKSGQFATMVNSYYSASSGGRGGVQAYETITEPHIPHPPSGIGELLSGNWDLQKQGEQIPTILNNVELGEKQRGIDPYNAAPTAAGSGGTSNAVDDAMIKHGLMP